MHLWDVKRTSGVPCLWSSIVPHTYVKMVIAPPYLALRKFNELPEQNSSKHLLWLVHFWSWLFSLAAHCQFRRYFCTSGVPCCSSISSLLLLLVNELKKFILFQRRLRKIWNQLPSVSFGLIYMSEGQNGTLLWWHCPFKLEEGHIKFTHKIIHFHLSPSTIQLGILWILLLIILYTYLIPCFWHDII
jgi:hypothetical protein